MTELHAEHRATLLAYARHTLTAVVAGRGADPPPQGVPFDAPAAVFVTLRREGELRGCVGTIHANRPLGAIVAEMTRAAAQEDPRFPPVVTREVAGLSIEISRLTVPVRAAPEDIVPGRHGVIVSGRGRRGLLLPQVATEFGVDAVGFLKLACRKAGLPPDAWRGGAVVLEIFETEVFAE